MEFNFDIENEHELDESAQSLEYLNIYNYQSKYDIIFAFFAVPHQYWTEVCNNSM
jgi:hypothetical protein